MACADHLVASLRLVEARLAARSGTLTHPTTAHRFDDQGPGTETHKEHIYSYIHMFILSVRTRNT